MKSYKTILELCRNDIIAGYRAAGTANSIPNLSYLSVCLLIEIGGIESLKNYKGVGPKNRNGVTLSTYLDSLISQYKSDLKNLTGGYDKLKLLQSTSPNILTDLGIPHLISTFQSSAETFDDEDENPDRSDKRRRSDRSDDDDTDDDDGFSHPTSSRKQVRMDEPGPSGTGGTSTTHSTLIKDLDPRGKKI